MHNLLRLGMAVLIGNMMLAGTSHAGPACTEQPESEWLTEATMRERIQTSGYTIEVFKITKGKCYEIYGRSVNGNRVEVYYHPITGEVIKETVRN